MGVIIVRVALNAFIPALIGIFGYDGIRGGGYSTIYKPGHLIEEVSLILISLTWYEALMYLISPYHIWKKRKRFFGLKKDADGKLIDMTQAEANKLWEKIELNIPNQIADNYVMLVVALIYLPIIPAAIILCCLSLVLQFALLKYKLFNHHKTPRELHSSIIHKFAGQLPWINYGSSITLLLFVIFEHREAEKLYNAGEPILLHDFENRQVLVVVYLVISSIFMVLPIGSCLVNFFSCIFCCLRCCDCEKKRNNLMFYDVAGTFTSHYDMSNPVS